MQGDDPLRSDAFKRSKATFFSAVTGQDYDVPSGSGLHSATSTKSGGHVQLVEDRKAIQLLNSDIVTQAKTKVSSMYAIQFVENERWPRSDNEIRKLEKEFISDPKLRTPEGVSSPRD